MFCISVMIYCIVAVNNVSNRFNLTHECIEIYAVEVFEFLV